MIKEYIEDLPGGEKFIQAQRVFGLAAGMILGVLIGYLNGILKVLEVLGKVNINNKLVLEQIQNSISEGFYIQIVFIIILIVIGVVGYYYQLNDADKRYRRKVENKT